MEKIYFVLCLKMATCELLHEKVLSGSIQPSAIVEPYFLKICPKNSICGLHFPFSRYILCNPLVAFLYFF